MSRIILEVSGGLQPNVHYKTVWYSRPSIICLILLSQLYLLLLYIQVFCSSHLPLNPFAVSQDHTALPFLSGLARACCQAKAIIFHHPKWYLSINFSTFISSLKIVTERNGLLRQLAYNKLYMFKIQFVKFKHMYIPMKTSLQST